MDALEETGLTPADPGFYPAARRCVIDLGIVRRRKVDVAADIPARRIADLPVELDDEAGRSIRAAERELARRLVAALRERAGHPHVRRRASTASTTSWCAGSRPGSARTPTTTTGENVFSMMRRIGQAKAGLAADYAAQLARNVGKVVFFAKHIDVMDVAEETFAKRGHPVLLDPRRPDRRRRGRSNIDAFVKDPDVAVAVCSLTAAGVGLNLQVASNVVLAELSWTDAEQTQAIDRSAPDRPDRAGHRVADHRRADHRRQDRRADRQQGRAGRPGARRLRRGGRVVGRHPARGAGRPADRRADVAALDVPG